jgi:hypothetical protein
VVGGAQKLGEGIEVGAVQAEFTCHPELESAWFHNPSKRLVSTLQSAWFHNLQTEM